ncbi:transcription elongation factor SPT4 [Microbotryum lychnidis-dioicae p1A1 Lamole]|uniref:Transcription elongation factor SPT4 n=2 Tax=Microbotryum TaxID=34416 RepID=U5H3C6_USTV1|nr:transcription elongation factor SPT4 [Microbotryum lychnidis-dioicae p1A1 Lamole]SCZ99250.1 BZ3501_MvSof-1269-A2-R1_Chr7-1g09153 [Microbotryum saponariae]SDA03469.1 BZ3500_MvSof-1268-A1-R1_Chr7-1g09448 [Microbotryum saponariae]|eukprot:KDE07939.1 transcription elongation factor SPT4 [Microbotryum lychnidis-dioicae p1A1 Lamole]
MSASKKLRACLMCSFVAMPSEFRRDGCPNCDEYLEMKGSSDRVVECTTTKFDGAIALINPRESWVAKWQRNDKHSPGVYAVRVTGQLPEQIVEDLEARGVTVHSREMNDD